MSEQPQSVTFPCPLCGGNLEVAAADVGKFAPCPHCGQEIPLEKQVQEDFVIQSSNVAQAMNTIKNPSHFSRWILPIASILPLLVGIICMQTASGAPDQKEGAAMVFGFFFLPISFVLALISAGVTWKCWPYCSRVDRVVGLIPLFGILALVLVGVIVAIFFG
jgi:hypothetical protein